MEKLNAKYENIINLSKTLNCKFLENEPLKKYTSFKIGGNADVVIFPKNEGTLKALMKEIKKESLPYFVLGKGSNLLVADSGFRGVVLILDAEFKTIEKEGSILCCKAGAPLAKACVFAMQNGLSGLEFAWGIPGSCGGALYMNAGAYGSDMSNVILEATHLNEKGELETLTKDEMELSYRKSIYSKKPFIITSMKLLLKKDDPKEIKKRMYEIISKRKSKQPLEFPSAGSTFKRPGNGFYAAALIESAGLKGTSVGGAAVSSKHSGFIVNKGGATASDVADLVRIVKEKVYKQNKINLECEIKTLGDIKI